MIRGYTNYTEAEMTLFAAWKQKIEQIFQRHGYTPFTMRPVEKLDDLTKKGGVNHQIFSLNQVQNSNDAKLGLPFDRTVPFALWVNQYVKELCYPVKRSDVSYSFRGEKAQAGRFRAFFQADIDVVDHKINYVAEAECLATVFEALRSLNIGSFKMYINNVKISKALASLTQLEDSKLESFLQIIDKMEKVPRETIIQDILSLSPHLDKHLVGNLVELFAYKGPLKDFNIPNQIQDQLLETIAELNKIMSVLGALGVDTSCVLFSPSIVRGLNYYTGIVFETFLDEGREFGSIASGGRYDNLLEGLGGKTPLEGVGGSIGLTRLFDVCNRIEKIKPSRNSAADIMVTSRDHVHQLQALEVVKQLRDADFNVDFYIGNAENIGKKLNYANRKGIPFVVIVMDECSYVVKEMLSGNQKEVSTPQLAVQHLLDGSFCTSTT